jgi:MFS family permease
VVETSRELIETVDVGSIGSPLLAKVADRSAFKTYLLLFSAYFVFGALFQVFPPLFAPVIQTFAVSRALASLTMTLFMAPIVVLAILAGIAVDRYGTGVVGRAAFGVLFVGGVATGLVGTFPLLLVARAVSGIGGGLLLVTLLKVIVERIPSDRRGLALGIFAAGFPAGTSVAFNLLGALGRDTGWRTAVLAAAACVGIGALLFWQLTPEASAPPPAPTARSTRALRNPELWRLATTTAFGYSAILGFTTWAPATLVRYASVPGWVAAFIASLLLLIDIPFSPLWGRLSDRIGRRKPFIVAAFAIYLTGSLLVPPVGRVPGIAIPGLLAVVLVMGVGCAMFFPTALAIPPEVVPVELTGAAYGLFFTAQVIGMMAGPLLVGTVIDQTSTVGGFLTISVLALGGVLSALTLRSR